MDDNLHDKRVYQELNIVNFVEITIIMELKELGIVMDLFDSFLRDVKKISDVGFDLMSQQYCLLGSFTSLLSFIIRKFYGDRGVDLVMWYALENDFGRGGLDYNGVCCSDLSSLYSALTGDSVRSIFGRPDILPISGESE